MLPFTSSRACLTASKHLASAISSRTANGQAARAFRRQHRYQYQSSVATVDPSSVVGHFRQRDDRDAADENVNMTQVGRHSVPVRPLQTQYHQQRYYTTTRPSERAAAIVLGLASVSALAYAGSSAIQSYNEWKAAQPTEEELEAARKEEEKERARRQTEQEESSKQTNESVENEGPRENIFKQFFDVGSKYYEGGFEDTMTKREAALILGVRESSSAQRIKDAHRKLLILNHPDTGGSTYMAGKINEAKELLLKGKQK